jgi:hypothetical protein
MRLSRAMRRLAYYTVEEAGSMAPICWSRSESYRGVERGDIPVEKDGKFLLVPRRKWDAKLKRMRQRLRAAGLKRRVKSKPTTKAVARKAAPKAGTQEADTASA